MPLLLLAACGVPDTTSTAPPTLSELQEEVFTPSCAFSTCHASPGASGLVLEQGATFGAIVEVDSHDDPGRTLVVPGDAEASYLVHKIRGDDDIVGVPMPQTGGPLDPGLVQLVESWIDAGALDD